MSCPPGRSRNVSAVPQGRDSCPGPSPLCAAVRLRAAITPPHSQDESAAEVLGCAMRLHTRKTLERRQPGVEYSQLVLSQRQHREGWDFSLITQGREERNSTIFIRGSTQIIENNLEMSPDVRILI